MGYHRFFCTIGLFILHVGILLLIVGRSKDKRLNFSDTTLQSKFMLAAVFLIPTGTIWLSIQLAVWRHQRGYWCTKKSNDGEVGTWLVDLEPRVVPSLQPRQPYYTSARDDWIPIYQKNCKYLARGSRVLQTHV